MATFDYDDLFADRRVIIFSLTNFRTVSSSKQMQGFIDNYDKFIELGINKICVIDSSDWLVGPWVDKRSQDMIGLPDRDMSFVRAVADHCEYQKDTVDLARYWQYVVIINNGELEKIWHNPFKENTKLVILKSNEYRYRKISPDVVLKYLVDNQVTNNI